MPYLFRPSAFQRGHEFGTLLRRHLGQQCLQVHRAARLASGIGVGIGVESGLTWDCPFCAPLGLSGDDDGLGREFARVIEGDLFPVDGDGSLDLLGRAAVQLRANGMRGVVHVVLRLLVVDVIAYICHDAIRCGF